MYAAIPFPQVPTASTASRRIDIRHRADEVIMPITVRWTFASVPSDASRVAHFVISRSREHERNPPSIAEMYAGADVFFGLTTFGLNVRTNIALSQGWQTMEAHIEGIVVAGDLFACVRNDLGTTLDFRCEFYYGVKAVSRVEKAMAIWRRETAESPN